MAPEQERARRQVAQPHLRTRESQEGQNRVFLGAESVFGEERENLAADENAKERLVLRRLREDREIQRGLAYFQATEPPNHPFNADAPQAARQLTAR